MNKQMSPYIMVVVGLSKVSSKNLYEKYFECSCSTVSRILLGNKDRCLIRNWSLVLFHSKKYGPKKDLSCNDFAASIEIGFPASRISSKIKRNPFFPTKIDASNGFFVSESALGIFLRLFTIFFSICFNSASFSLINKMTEEGDFASNHFTLFLTTYETTPLSINLFNAPYTLVLFNLVSTLILFAVLPPSLNNPRYTFISNVVKPNVDSSFSSIVARGFFRRI